MRLRRRLAFHFTYQLIAFSVLMLLLLMAGLFVIINQIGNDDIQRNTSAGMLSAITTETVTEGGEVKLREYWKVLIKEQMMWLQVVDMEGRVIFSSNTPEDVPASYSVSRLLEIEEERRLGKYTVDGEMDLFYEEPLLFLLGRVDESADKLRAWHTVYSKQGLAADDVTVKLDEEVRATGGYLHIIDPEGSVVQSLGEDPGNKRSYSPLEILSMQEKPGDYSTSIHLYRDKDNGSTWVYHIPQKGAVKKQPIMTEALHAVLLAGAVVLAAALAASVWHGYRYSRPLLLFTGWFERMRNGSYEDVLTPKDRKRVFRKNGKMRIRYRLYKEVIHSFYQMAEQLAEAERERKQLERSREEWMSGISHDLRTPLSSIQGYGYMLESAAADWTLAELKEMGTVIREKGDYMLELIDDFSFIFRLKTESQLPQNLTRLDLNELVRRCVLKYVNDATMEGVTFIYEGREEPVWTRGSVKWLHRLMDNLLFNAVKHNPKGITVTVRVDEQPGGASIMVRDDGVGMDEETKRNLFERYYRGTNTEERVEGSGLGMSIAKAIVDVHGGQVQIESEQGQGTTVTATFPVVKPACPSSLPAWKDSAVG